MAVVRLNWDTRKFKYSHIYLSIIVTVTGVLLGTPLPNPSGITGVMFIIVRLFS